MFMGRDTLLKRTEAKKEKAKQKSKAVTSKEKKQATHSKKGTDVRTKTTKTEKTTRKTVKENEKPKAIKTSQDVPETKLKTEEQEIKEPPAQVTNEVAAETASQPTKELEPEKEPEKKLESSQESVVVKTEVTMPKEPAKNNIWIYGASAALLLLLVLLTASLTNSNTFSFRQKGNTLELWKGSFAPMGMERIRIFSDLQLPSDEEGKTIIKDTYTKKEAYHILFQYSLAKADDALSRQESPDLKEINAFLEEARGYALTEDAKETVRLRKNGLRFLVLMGKVNVALARNTEEDLRAAKEYLAEIDQLDTTPIQRQMIKEKISAVESALKKISSEKGK
jgi:hypothetical protein